MSLERVVELVTAALPPGFVVYDGGVSDKVEDLPDLYVVIYPSTPLAITGDVAVTPSGRAYSWQVTSVAIAPNVEGIADARWQASWAAGLVRDHLVAARLTPGGQKIDHTSSQPVARDEQIVSRTVVAAMDRYAALT